MASKLELTAHAYRRNEKRMLPSPKQIRRVIPQFGIAVLFISTSGCQLCCPPYMDDYATVGGKWARSHPSEGVVGSAFTDPSSTQIYGDEGTIVLPQESLPYDQSLQPEMSQPEMWNTMPSEADSTYFEDDGSSIIILE